MKAARGLRRALDWRPLAVLGVMSAAITVAALNVLAARHPLRFDWTGDRTYTLSPSTEGTLRQLSERVELVIFLGRSDPLYASVKQLLGSYQAASHWLETRFVDPDRDPGQLLALQAKYGIEAGRAENGRVVTDTLIIVAKGSHHWYITHDDIIRYDEEQGIAAPQLERALTIGLRQVLVPTAVRICFTTGHEELSIDDVSPTGLAELSRRLETDNYEVAEVDLSANQQPNLENCGLIIVAAPDVPFSPSAADLVAARFNSGGNVLVLASAGLSETLNVEDRGLGRLTRLAGIEFGGGVILEKSPERRMPDGMGETFFALPADHPVTAGLFRRGRPELQALVTLAQPLVAIDGRAVPATLLQSSELAQTPLNLRSSMEEGDSQREPPSDGKPKIVAMASEIHSALQGSAEKTARRQSRDSVTAGKSTRRAKQEETPTRMVVAPASIAFARNWRDPTLMGTRRFFEGALSWLSARPMLVDVPNKKGHAIGLALTDAGLTEVRRYVLMYMPGCAAALAALVLLRRRGREKRQPASETEL